MKKTARILALALSLLMVLTACSGAKTPAPSKTPDNSAAPDVTAAPSEEPTAPVSTEFVPRLDTEKTVEMDAAVFFGNFEAFDQVINHFNEY